MFSIYEQNVATWDRYHLTGWTLQFDWEGRYGLTVINDLNRLPGMDAKIRMTPSVANSTRLEAD